MDTNTQTSSMRKGFADGILSAAISNPNIVVLSADLTESLALDSFKQKYPDRFFDMGVAEQNMMTVASGMARMGKIPFVGSYAVFSPGRNWEQIRTTICYNDVPVKIIGSHAGLNVGPDGGSHQALEDIALMRSLPRMTVLSPCDSVEAEAMAKACISINGPVYVRLSRDKTPIVTSKNDKIEIGKARTLIDVPKGKDKHAAIIATGYMVHKALVAAHALAKKNINVAVIDLHTIKPLDNDLILRVARDYGAIVSVEDHQIAGGMGSAIAELLAAERPTPIEFIGVRDAFGQSGQPDELYKLYGMDEVAIEKAVNKVILRKR